jgi:hypothetical protein
MSDDRWAMGDGRWAMGDGRWAMGDARMMPQAFYVIVVIAPLMVFLNFGRQRIVRLPWIAVPLGVAMLCALISQLAWPHPPADGHYGLMRAVSGLGTAVWLLGMINAWRFRSIAQGLTKEIEAGLLQLESGSIRSEAVGGTLHEQLEELARLIEPIGVVPGSDITSAWLTARLREVEAARLPQPERMNG